MSMSLAHYTFRCLYHILQLLAVYEAYAILSIKSRRERDRSKDDDVVVCSAFSKLWHLTTDNEFHPSWQAPILKSYFYCPNFHYDGIYTMSLVR